MHERNCRAAGRSRRCPVTARTSRGRLISSALPPPSGRVRASPRSSCGLGTRRCRLCRLWGTGERRRRAAERSRRRPAAARTSRGRLISSALSPPSGRFRAPPHSSRGLGMRHRRRCRLWGDGEGRWCAAAQSQRRAAAAWTRRGRPDSSGAASSFRRVRRPGASPRSPHGLGTRCCGQGGSYGACGNFGALRDDRAAARPPPGRADVASTARVRRHASVASGRLPARSMRPERGAVDGAAHLGAGGNCLRAAGSLRCRPTAAWMISGCSGSSASPPPSGGL